MSDNVTLPSVSGVFVAATDEVNGAQFQRVKLDIGDDGNSSPITASNKLPVVDSAVVSGISSVLSKLSGDPATQTTLAAVLAKLSSDPATQTTLASILAKLSSDPASETKLEAIRTLLAAALTVNLPTGASTSAKQDTGNTSLSNIDNKTPALGQALSGASSPVVLPAAQITALTPPAAITNFANETGGNLASAAGALGATADAAVVTDANGTLSAKLRGLVKIFADIWDSTNHWFQVKVMNGTAAVPLRVDPVNTTAQKVNLCDGSGNPISSTAGALNISGGGSGSGGAVTVADGADVTLGANADAAVYTDAAGTVSGKLRGLVRLVASVISGGLVQIRTLTTSDAITATIGTDSVGLAKEAGGNLAAIKAKTDNIPAQGQALAAGSLPVVLPSLQVTAMTPPAAITNFANETGGNLAAIKAKTDNIPPLGQAVVGSSVPVVLPATQIATLTPPAALTNFANETGGNLAAIKAKTDNIPAQGQALAAASLPVVLPALQVTALTPPAAITGFALETGGNLAAIKTNTDKIPTNPAKDKSTSTAQNNGQVSVGSTATQILAANAARKRLVIINTGTTVVYLGPAGVTTSTGHYLAGIAGYPVSIYTKAAIYGIVSSGTQTVTYWEEVD